MKKELLYIPITENTNRLLLEQESYTYPQGAYTFHQTKGRGTKGRIWEAAAGKNLAFSMLVDFPLVAHGVIPLVTGLGAVVALQKYYGIEVGLKWPNDLMVQGNKLGGILCESRITGQNSRIVVGMGMNLKTTEEEFLQRGITTATSLALMGVTEKPLTLFAELLYATLCDYFKRLKDEGFAGRLQEEYRQHSVTLGKEIRLIGKETEVGFAEDIDTDGSLLVILENKRQKSFYSGDVSVRGLVGYS